jgi:hypothetical protein
MVVPILTSLGWRDEAWLGIGNSSKRRRIAVKHTNNNLMMDTAFGETLSVVSGTRISACVSSSCTILVVSALGTANVME